MTIIVVCDVINNNDKLKRVSDKEVMLYRKDAPMIKVNGVNKIEVMRDKYFPLSIF